MVRADYTTIDGRKACETVIKGSRFIGIASPVTDEPDLRSFLAGVRTEFPEATHYCYAAVFGGSSYIERFSDDCEPSDTAGRPILGVIRAHKLTDTAIVVVRYFGGTLLGRGGLVHAYSGAATAVIGICGIKEVRMCSSFAVTIPYQDYNRFMKIMTPLFASPPECEYTADVRIVVHITEDRTAEFEKAMMEFSGGKLFAVPLGTGYLRSPRTEKNTVISPRVSR